MNVWMEVPPYRARHARPSLPVRLARMPARAWSRLVLSLSGVSVG